MKLPNEILEFAEKYAFAFDPRKNGYSKINLFDYQKKLLQQLETQQFTIIKQSRNVGIDTAVAIYIANFLLKNNGKHVLVISNDTYGAIHFINKVKIILINAKVDILNVSKKNIYLKNGSKITVTGCNSPNTGRETIVDLLYMNNIEFMTYPEDAWIGAGMSLASTGGSAIFSSTPKYKDSYFHKMWKLSKKKKNGFKPINITWKDVPNCDEEWYKKQCLMLGNIPDRIATEIDGNFIKKKEIKKTAINIRLELGKKEQILKRMKQKNISSITDYIMELIDKDLKC